MFADKQTKQTDRQTDETYRLLTVGLSICETFDDW